MPVVSPDPPKLSFFVPETRTAAASCSAPQDPDHVLQAVPVASSEAVPFVRTTGAAGGLQWAKLADDSMRFLAIMHAFRWATEPGTRAGGIGLGGGYFRSVRNLHGWADGDPFYVNYIGHPMQGAVSARLFSVNDRRFNKLEFGRSLDYWKGKLRAAAFAWAFSEQFEIGPLSEASIGHIQGDFPQQGFVDHVITPTAGLVWTVGEDAVDRYVIRPLEDRTTNRWLRLALRTGLNPARSFANLVDGRAPWNRGTRAGIGAYRPEPRTAHTGRGSYGGNPHASEAKAAPFEFAVASSLRQVGRTLCLGGGADVATRVTANLQMVLAVNGCKLIGLPENVSGDALIYQFGPRWSPAPTGKWSPFAHLLVGGIKVGEERLYPDKKIAVEEANRTLDPVLAYTLHSQYTTSERSSGLAVTAGAGIDFKLNDALAIRVANLDYLHSNLNDINGTPVNTGFQFSTGMVLRLGTW